MSEHVHHHHHGAPPRLSPVVQRRLLLAVAPFVVGTIVGLFLLWPGGDLETKALPGSDVAQFRGEVIDVDRGGCPAPPQAQALVCSEVTAELIEGADAGERFSFNHSTGPNSRGMEAGDSILVAKAPPSEQQGPTYYFLDYDRRLPLALLAILFGVVVVGLSRWHGVFSLVGVALSMMVLVLFVMPAILEGSSPLAVAVVGASMIMFANLYLAHGFNGRTTTAILGTMLSLALTGLLAVAFVEFGRFTGFGSEEASFLQLSSDRINLQGLLLGGIIIGTLGVLDDVTITQASAVWELQAANRNFGFGDLYKSALRIGRDHIASTVNTLVLAYAGASLPLLILFSVSGRELVGVLNAEIVAEEVVRTLVGSIGLVASVPITTALAAAVVSSPGPSELAEPLRPGNRTWSRKQRRKRAPKDRRSRHELEWRQGHDDTSTEQDFWNVLDPSETRADDPDKETPKQ